MKIDQNLSCQVWHFIILISLTFLRNCLQRILRRSVTFSSPQHRQGGSGWGNEGKRVKGALLQALVLGRPQLPKQVNEIEMIKYQLNGIE